MMNEQTNDLLTELLSVKKNWKCQALFIDLTWSDLQERKSGGGAQPSL